MKTKTLILAGISMLIFTCSFAQTLSMTFIKSATTLERQAFTDEMTKKKFYIVEESSKKSTNAIMQGGTFYCNEKERELGYAEIDVISQITGTKKITEITFLKGGKHDYTKNFGEIYNQMTSVLNKTAAFQSKKYKVEVSTFTKDKIYYYTYKVNDVPVIVIANYKIDEEYF